MSGQGETLAEWRGAARVSGELGQGLDKLHEERKSAASAARGGKLALRELAKKMQGLHDKADADFEAGKMEGLDAPAVRRMVKLFVTYAIESATNLAMQQASAELVQDGAAASLRKAVELAQKHHDVANARVGHLEAAAAPDEQAPEKPASGAPKRRNGPGRAQGARTLADARAGREGPESEPALEAAKPKPKRKRATKKRAAKKTTKKTAKRTTKKRGA